MKNGVDQEAPKLIPHLYIHTNYVIHYRNLKYLEELGIRITKLHKTISFQQKTWMKPYIEFDSNRRKEAMNDFQRDLSKLSNNSIFGKNCEQVNNRIELKLTTDHDRAIKRLSKIHFKKAADAWTVCISLRCLNKRFCTISHPRSAPVCWISINCI